MRALDGQWYFLNNDCKTAHTCVCGFCKRGEECDYGDCRRPVSGHHRVFGYPACAKHAA